MTSAQDGNQIQISFTAVTCGAPFDLLGRGGNNGIGVAVTGLRRWAALLCVAGTGVTPLLGQTVISARSGLIHYFEGNVFLNEELLQRAPNRFAQLEPYDVLRTGLGRAEILAGPDIYLRIRDRSSIRLLSDSLAEPRYELLSGSLILEAQEVPKGATLRVIWRDFAAIVTRHSIFRLDAPTGNLRVIEGEVRIGAGDRQIRVTRGRWISLKGELATGKFDRTLGDSFDIWSARRSQMLAAAAFRRMRGSRPLRRSPPLSGAPQPQVTGSQDPAAQNPSP